MKKFERMMNKHRYAAVEAAEDLEDGDGQQSVQTVNSTSSTSNNTKSSTSWVIILVMAMLLVVLYADEMRMKKFYALIDKRMEQLVNKEMVVNVQVHSVSSSDSSPVGQDRPQETQQEEDADDDEEFERAKQVVIDEEATEKDFSLGNLITVGFGSHNRPEKCLLSIHAVHKFYPNIKIVVADDGEKDMSHRYKDVADFVTYVKVDYDSGLSATRNIIIQHVETEYVFITDEDLMFTKTTNLTKLFQVLQEPNVVIAAGRIKGWPRMFGAEIPVIPNNKGEPIAHICQTANEDLKVDPKTGCYDTQRCLNLFLTRTKFLRRNPWPNELKLAEHTVFFGTIQLHAYPEKHRVQICPHVELFHNHHSNPNGYDKDRARGKAYRKQWEDPKQLSKYDVTVDKHCGR